MTVGMWWKATLLKMFSLPKRKKRKKRKLVASFVNCNTSDVVYRLQCSCPCFYIQCSWSNWENAEGKGIRAVQWILVFPEPGTTWLPCMLWLHNGSDRCKILGVIVTWFDRFRYIFATIRCYLMFLLVSIFWHQCLQMNHPFFSFNRHDPSDQDIHQELDFHLVFSCFTVCSCYPLWSVYSMMYSFKTIPLVDKVCFCT